MKRYAEDKHIGLHCPDIILNWIPKEGDVLFFTCRFIWRVHSWEKVGNVACESLRLCFSWKSSSRGMLRIPLGLLVIVTELLWWVEIEKGRDMRGQWAATRSLRLMAEELGVREPVSRKYCGKKRSPIGNLFERSLFTKICFENCTSSCLEVTNTSIPLRPPERYVSHVLVKAYMKIVLIQC